MEKIKASDVTALRIAYILLKEYGYQILMVKEDDENIWLLNRSAPISVVRINSLGLNDVPTSSGKLKAIRNSIMNLMSRGKPMLEIYTGHETGSFEQSDNKISWEVDITTGLPAEIMEQLPLLVWAMGPVEEPEAAFEEINRRLELLQHAKQAKAQPKPMATIVVMGICIVLHLGFYGLLSVSQDPIAISIVLGSYYQAMVLGLGEYWRLFTAGFIHVDPFHLAMNMYALWNIGKLLEPLIGRNKFLITLLGGSVASFAMVFAVAGNEVHLGLSGGIYALVVVLFMKFYQQGLLKNPMMRRQLSLLIMINVFISLMPGISLWGHLGGALFGAMMGVIFFFGTKSLKINTAIATLILVAGLMVVGLRPKPLSAIYQGTDQNVANIYRDLGFGTIGDQIVVKMLKYYTGD